jgi:hypothetical protein
MVELPHGRERWIVVRSKEGVERARATLQRQATCDLASWTKGTSENYLPKSRE